MYNFTDETLMKIAKDAREAAEKALAHEVPFLGSMPAAETYGYEPYSLEAKLFSPIYLYTIHKALGNGMDGGIPVSAQGYIMME